MWKLSTFICSSGCEMGGGGVTYGEEGIMRGEPWGGVVGGAER